MCRTDWERSGAGEEGWVSREGLAGLAVCQEVLQELGVPRRLKLVGAQEEMLGAMEVWDGAEGGKSLSAAEGCLCLGKGRLGSAED